jgi:AraC-like DNA-binding protein
LGDLYNEIHSQEGLYEALKNSYPVQAMLHQERVTLLKDSLYNMETSSQLSKYNAEYGNDLLKEKGLRHERFIRYTLLIGGGLLLLLLIAVIWGAWMARRRDKMQMNRYDKLQDNMDVLNEKYELLRNRYSNAMATRSTDDEEGEEGLAPADCEFLNKTTRVVEQQVEIGKFDVDTVASQLNLSPSQFRRRLSALTGTSPQLFIQNVRMKKARYLLDNHPELNINEIAMKCGYEENSTFTRVFKRVFGITPTDYINGRLDDDVDDETQD